MKRFQGAEGVVFTLANEDFFNEYCERLIDPKPGDSVEVAWEGTFNLLANEVRHFPFFVCYLCFCAFQSVKFGAFPAGF